MISVLTRFASLCIVKVSFYKWRTHKWLEKPQRNALEAQKQKLLHPVNMKTVMAKAKEAGLTPEEIAKKLGLDV